MEDDISPLQRIGGDNVLSANYRDFIQQTLVHEGGHGLEDAITFFISPDWESYENRFKNYLNDFEHPLFRGVGSVIGYNSLADKMYWSRTREFIERAQISRYEQTRPIREAIPEYFRAYYFGPQILDGDQIAVFDIIDWGLREEQSFDFLDRLIQLDLER